MKNFYRPHPWLDMLYQDFEFHYFIAPVPSFKTRQVVGSKKYDMP